MNRLFLHIFIAAAAFSFSSCDLFETRSAEPPNQARSSYEQPVEPETVLSNLVNSFTDLNVSNYSACFTNYSYSGKNFIFIPSAGASLQYPELINSWNINSEEQYFKNLVTRIPEDARITLTLSNDNYNLLGDSAIVTATYTLTVPQYENNIPANYSGEMRISLIRDSRSLWSIYYWQDIKKDDVASWSELKGRLYY
jgi:hypothetical protein